MKSFLGIHVSKFLSVFSIVAAMVTSSAYQYMNFQINNWNTPFTGNQTPRPVAAISSSGVSNQTTLETMVTTMEEETEPVPTDAETTEETTEVISTTEETTVETEAVTTEEASSEETTVEETEPAVEETEAESIASIPEEMIAIPAVTEAPAETVAVPAVETTAPPKKQDVVEAPTKPETPTYAPAVILTGVCDYSYATSQQYEIFKARIMMRINELRQSVGLALLSSSDSLTGCADLRSKEVVGLFSHTRPDGTRGCYSVAACKGEYEYAVSCLLTGASNSYWLGENLAYQYAWSDYTGTDSEIIALADDVFESWRNSPTHYANMVNGNFTMVGVGLDVSLEEGYYRYTSVLLFSNLY